MSLSCKTKTDQKLTNLKYPNEYKYRIEGNVMTDKGPHSAVFFIDTFEIVDGGKCLEYTNSDSTVQTIYSPYRIVHIK